jgi:hypothetical protein
MSDVLYARVQPELKAAVDAFAEGRGISMNAAIIDLATRGLASVAAENVTRSSLEKLEHERAKLAKQLAAQQSLSQNLEAFIQQAKGPAGLCPDDACGTRVSGLDLLRGRCPKCMTALSSLPTTSKPLDGQLLLLIGAVGLLAGAAVWATK